jgi:hypothetical protein
MFLTENERRLQLRQVAWIRMPAGQDVGGRLTFTHYAAADEAGKVVGDHLLCGRPLPSEWDIANGRFEHFGDGICGRCLTRFEKRLREHNKGDKS